MKSNKTIITILAFVAGAAVLFGGSFLVAKLFTDKLNINETIEGAGEAISRTEIEASNSVRESIIEDANAKPTMSFNGHSYTYNENLDVLLIIGLDDRDIIDYEAQGKNKNYACADLLLVAVFDKTDKTYTLIQINRDTMAELMTYDRLGNFAGMKTKQISLAHTYRTRHEDACVDTEFAVSHLLDDVEISNYFALTMDAIPILNDSVGGVTVTIEDDFSQIDESLVMGQTVTLHGSQAETFVRSRSRIGNSPTNINRMNRQRVYMSELLVLLGQKTSSSNSFAFDLFDKLSPYMITDCSYDQLSAYISQFSGYTLDKIVTPEGHTEIGDNDLMEFYIDDSSLKEIIINTFYTKVN